MSLRYGTSAVAKRPRVRHASAYQSPRDAVRLLAENHKPKIRTAISSALKAARRSVPTKDIERLIRARDLMGAADLVNVASLAHALRGAFEKIADAYRAAASHGEDQIHAARRRRVHKDSATFGGDKQAPSKFAFDLYTDEVTSELKDYQDAFIGNLTDDMRQTLFEAISNGVRDGLDPADVAASVRDTIGLSDRLATAVDNYRAALENGTSDALDRALRDDSYDAEVQAAIDAGEILDADMIDELVNAYSERALDYRADMIAQTESNRAANMGLQSAYGQAIKDGVFPNDAVRQYWMLALDEKTCDDCQSVADDNADGIEIGDTFDSADGGVDSPPLHPNCRCSVEIRTNLDMVDATESGDQTEQDDE